MRFEALNQLFKNIAIGGSYRDTTRRCAIFWCMRSALARQHYSWDDWAATRVLSSSGQITFDLHNTANLPAHLKETVELFGEELFGDQLTTQYISELSHDGHTIHAGESWLFFQLDDGHQWNLAYVKPLTGIFSVSDSFFFHLVVYEGIEVPPGDPTRVVEIPSDANSNDEIISIEEIFQMKVMWVQHHEQLGGSDKWTFVDV